MKSFVLLFCLLLAMWVVLGAAFLTEEPPGGRGQPHDEFGAMLQGGAAASSRIAFLGWCLGVLQIAVFVTCMTLGISRSRRTRKAKGAANGRGWLSALFGAGSVAYVGVFTLMVWAERTAATSGEVAFLGPFPAATSWMLLGMWAAPLLFVAAYIVGFSRWIFTDSDRARFETLLAVARQTDPEDAS